MVNKLQNSGSLESQLTAITPLDGRYSPRLGSLSEYASEYALIKNRTEIEIKYLMALSEIGLVRHFTKEETQILNDTIDDFSIDDAVKVKTLEEKTRHDVKAMERHLRTQLEGTSLSDTLEMIHFGLTSEDVNNLSYRLILKRSSENVGIPEIEKLIKDITDKAEQYKSVAMLARTHGQAAVPTTLGKELIVFAVRLKKQLDILKKIKLTGKLNGAVGNYNAIVLVHPQIDWIEFSEKFISSLGLEPNPYTTQINNSDDIAEYLEAYARINTILIGFNQDIWRYISDGWFSQLVKEGEVGSSTMPQKVNPIDFENSEGNLGVANSMIEFMARKLPVSRLQRDLSDSTVLRNLGTVIGYSVLSYKSTLTGLSRIHANKARIEIALNEDWSILTEAVQTVLRKAGVDDPYTMIASLSRGNKINAMEWSKWVEGLEIEDIYKTQLGKLTPSSYTGLAETLTERGIEEARKK